MLTNLMPKNADKFICDVCDFKCCKISNYNTHILTNKHKIYSNNSYCDDPDLFKEFESGQIQFLVNIRILVEGFNAPHIRSIFFLQISTSEIFIIQAIGRALRQHQDKRIATIYVPFTQESDLERIQTFIGQLSTYDERVKKSIDEKNIGKYVNPPIPRGEFIFNEINIDWRKEITLVEGPFDLTKCDNNATAILGSNMSRKSALFQAIARNRTPVVLALDSDMPEKQHKWASALSEFDLNVKILNLGDKKDVGEMTREEFLLAKSQAKLWDKFQGIINLSKIMRSGSMF